jgi:hypothetical protein
MVHFLFLVPGGPGRALSLGGLPAKCTAGPTAFFSF